MCDTQTVTTLFFDIDGTLIENQFSIKLLRKMLEEIANESNPTVEQLIKEFVDENVRRQQTDPNNVLTMDWEDIITTIANKYNVKLSASFDNLWQTTAHLDDILILDNAKSVLKELKTPQRKLVIASKGLSKYQLKVLQVCKLEVYFDDFLTPDITGFLKTQPEFYRTYTGQKNTFIQIGDNYQDDVVCAKQNGFYSILRLPNDEIGALTPFNRPNTLRDYSDLIKMNPDDMDILPDAIILSLEELKPVIEHIEQNPSLSNFS